MSDISALQETMANQIVELKAENARLKAEPPLGVHTDMFYEGECYLCKIWFGTNKNRKPLPIHDKFVLDAPEPRLTRERLDALIERLLKDWGPGDGAAKMWLDGLASRILAMDSPEVGET
jgi:hypothetical protein